MTDNGVIFAGCGGSEPAIVMCSPARPTNGGVCVSRFDRGYSVYSLAVSPSGTRLAGGTRAGLVRVHGLEGYHGAKNATPHFEFYHGADLNIAVPALAFVTDEILASGGEDGRIELWDVCRKKQLAALDAHADRVTALCALGSLVLASIGGDAILRIWDLDTLQPKFESDPFPLPQKSPLISLVFDPRLGRLLHPSRVGELYVYDTRREFEMHRVSAHEGDFLAIACGPQRVATAGRGDATLRLWPSALDRPVEEHALAEPVIGAGWIGPESLLIITEGGGGQVWSPDGRMRAAGWLDHQDLRVCAGLPTQLMLRGHGQMERAWRDEKLAEGQALAVQGGAEAQQRLLDVADQLQDRGFSAEATVLLAEFARASGRPAWELEARLALVASLGDDRCAVPVLCALADLLERVNEPRLAFRQCKKALRIEPRNRDARERVTRLLSHPFRRLWPRNCVRNDLRDSGAFEAELDKYTILDKRFVWRAVFDVLPAIREPARLDPGELARCLESLLTDPRPEAGSTERLQVTFLDDTVTRDVSCLYVPASGDAAGIAAAIEVQVHGAASLVTVYRVFDPSRLPLGGPTTAKARNQAVREAWIRLTCGAESTEWFGQIHERIAQSIKRLRADGKHGW